MTLRVIEVLPNIYKCEYFVIICKYDLNTSYQEHSTSDDIYIIIIILNKDYNNGVERERERERDV